MTTDQKPEAQAADAEIARLTAELRKCGKDNCMGRNVEGVTQWCTLEARDAAIAEAVAAERERCIAAVEAVPSHRWVDGSDQCGRPCPAKVVATKADFIAAIRTAQERT